MELLLILKPEKRPFIGILYDFTEANKAVTENRDLLGKKANFHIEFEPSALNTDIRLLCNDPISIRFYQGVKYKPQQLETFLKETKFIKEFNFAHVIFDKGKETIVYTQPDRIKFVLKVNKVGLNLTRSLYGRGALGRTI